MNNHLKSDQFVLNNQDLWFWLGGIGGQTHLRYPSWVKLGFPVGFGLQVHGSPHLGICLSLKLNSSDKPTVV
ncbi:MAG: hypothetical protein A2426_13420 [Candidatus Lambdaproteobacteria bacterium RIFOXYC1_FULL_56_13]|nr:MAG: hypothetical protein A2426_13420 [Candidatus Lambdaproteobacteria bacterium RIFOXYC1_FULL_56_13]